MSGAPRELTELSQLQEDITASLVDSLERHTLGLQKRRRRFHHLPVNSAQLRALRKVLCVSQTVMAKQLGTSVTTIQFWENNRRVPNRTFTQRIRKLATFNGIDLEHLDDPDYYRQQLNAHVGLEPVKVTLERLERVVMEAEKESQNAVVQSLERG